MESQSQDSGTGRVKKPFNKKNWRDKKYNHGHKVEQWRDKHKIAVKMRYKRMLKKEQKKNPHNSQPEDAAKVSKGVASNSKPKSGFSKARDEFTKKELSKEKKKEEFMRKQKEKAEAVKKYKEKKSVRLKVLNSKTKRGQPVMAGRMELLLAKIQEQCQND